MPDKPLAPVWRQNKGMRRLAALIVAATLAWPSTGFAQAQEPAAPSEPIDSTKIGVSLDRIKRELKQAEITEVSNDGRKVEFRVQVYGQAPRIDFFTNFPLDVGPVPYGGPTHREVVEFLTPKEYRGQTFPILGLAVLAAQKLYERGKKARCEQELAEYKALVMQGVPVAAPRCTQ
jgi:hypothetical protein